MVQFIPCIFLQISQCSEPWAGQLGDCGKWLSYKGPEDAYSRGYLLLSSYHNGIFAVSGESSGAYHNSLQLDSVYRALILLDEEFAIVVDSITTKKTSRISKFATIFNNVVNGFHPYTHHLPFRLINGFEMTKDKNTYRAIWISKEGQSPEANITTLTYKSLGQTRSVSNANVTLPIIDNHALTAFSFFSSNINIQALSMNEIDGIKILSVDILNYGTQQHFDIQIDAGFKDIYIKRTNKQPKRLQRRVILFIFLLLTGIILLKYSCKTLIKYFLWKIMYMTWSV